MHLRKKALQARPRLGIALFILMTAIAVISLMMRELISITSQEATRVRNAADRMQAVYLARSALNLSRFIIAIDRITKNATGKRETFSDTLKDLWTNPVIFPLSEQEISAIISGTSGLGSDSKDKEKQAPQNADDPKRKDLIKHCAEFFDDFPGNAVSLTSDLSAKFNLNDLTDVGNQDIGLAFQELLKPNVEFLRHLNERGVTPEQLYREIRDYADPDTNEYETNTPESGIYSAMRLDYEPKNRAFTNMDELKLIPHMDDFIFSYLSEHVNPYYTPQRLNKKININTASAQVFQSLLKGVSGAEEIAQKFIKDRTENKRVYNDKNYASLLSDALQLNNESIRLNLITGASESFKIETTAEVNRIRLKLESVVSRNLGGKKFEPLVVMRLSP